MSGIIIERKSLPLKGLPWRIVRAYSFDKYLNTQDKWKSIFCVGVSVIQLDFFHLGASLKSFKKMDGFICVTDTVKCRKQLYSVKHISSIDDIIVILLYKTRF